MHINSALPWATATQPVELIVCKKVTLQGAKHPCSKGEDSSVADGMAAQNAECCHYWAAHTDFQESPYARGEVKTHTQNTFICETRQIKYMKIAKEIMLTHYTEPWCKAFQFYF